jgi:hypothetical protein
MVMDFSGAPGQQDFSALIPNGTIARVSMEIRYPDGAAVGDMPELTRSSATEAQYLNCEFEVLSSPLVGRKFWQNIMYSGCKQKAIDMSFALFRAILESARNIRPDDMSELAHKARRVNSLSDFNGMEFAAKIGVQVDSKYGDKNKLQASVTPDKPEYKTAMQGATIVGKETARISATTKPAGPPSPSQANWSQQSGQQAQGGSGAVPRNNETSQSSNQNKPSSPVPDWAK